MALSEQQTRGRIDAVAAAMMPLLRGAYYAAKDQGKPFHTPKMFVFETPPKDGQEKPSTDFDVKFGSQLSWNETSDLLGARSALPASLVGNPKVDYLQFPNGETGFCLRVDYEYEGRKYEKAIYHGDAFGDGWVAYDWREIIE